MAIKKIRKILLLSLSSLFVLTTFFFLAETFFMLRYSNELVSVVLNNKTDNFKDTYSKWNKHSEIFLKVLKPIASIVPNSLEERLKIGVGLDFWETMVHDLPEILGKNNKKVYFVLLQNNMELRPTGGFLGSYAKLSFENGGLKQMIVQDIYVPDGQIEGHVDPPAPIQQAFKQGWFKLRDSNWDPDFPTSAKTVSWFFEKGNEEKESGIVAINLELIKDLLKVTGPLYLPDYKLNIDENNFYQVAQANSEADFFPGSTQKANILSSLSSVMLTKVKNLDSEDFMKIAKIFYKNLNNRQLLIYFENKELNDILQKLNWNGSLEKVYFEQDKINDYLYLVEANLGANKANGYVEREVEQEIDFSEKGKIRERVKILFKNSSTYFTPIKPFYWGDNYINYLRLYIPNIAEKITIKIEGNILDDKNIFFEEKKEFNLRGIGFFIMTPASSQKPVEVNFDLPFRTSRHNRKVPYKILIQKQPGISYIPYSLNLVKNGKSIFLIKKNLVRDTEIKAEIMYN